MPDLSDLSHSLTPPQVAAVLGITRQRVGQLVNQGALTVVYRRPHMTLIDAKSVRDHADLIEAKGRDQIAAADLIRKAVDELIEAAS